MSVDKKKSWDDRSETYSDPPISVRIPMFSDRKDTDFQALFTPPPLKK